MKIQNITHEALLATLDYDRLTGDFKNKTQRSPRAKIGEACGWINALGYRSLVIDRKYYLAHRLVVFFMTGQWPDAYVDHINGVRSDNRFENLRLASMEINMQNRRTARRDSVSGVLGAHWHKKSGKWASSIFADGKRHYLGRFDSAQDANSAYIKAKRQMHAGCTI